MKRIMIAWLMLCSASVFAQKINAAKVPASVKEVFSKSFGTASNVKWEKENGGYEAGFVHNGIKTSALFDENGKWLETETAIAASALPPAAKAYITGNYPGDKIKEAAKLQMADGSNNFEAEVKGMDLIFDSKGIFIKKIKG